MLHYSANYDHIGIVAAGRMTSHVCSVLIRPRLVNFSLIFTYFSCQPLRTIFVDDLHYIVEKKKNGELVTKNNKNNCIYLSCTQAKRKGGLGAFDRVYVLPGGAFDRGNTKRGCDDRGRMPSHRFTQPSIPSGSVNEYRLRLGRYKAGMCDAAWCAPYT